ncbi:MAG: zinc transporter, family [Thermoplasmata archaeon]|nr:zinc transporter, family [Thermoplasmata archaeon]
MLTSNVFLLGALAGFTIFLGLPVAFISRGAKWKTALNAVAIGILIFLLVEVLQKGWEPVEGSFVAATAGGAGWTAAWAKLAIFAFALSLGLLSLVWFEYRFIHHRAERDAQGNALPLTPAALSTMIAVGIGLHNFSEGLAIGASIASGALTFAVLLAIGFALHNATEGFGIAAPLHGTRPTWGFLALVGLVGGGPTFVGALLGSLWTSEYLDIAFLALAAGALLFVIKELLHHARKIPTPRDGFYVMSAVALGVLLGFGTDLVVTLAGA